MNSRIGDLSASLTDMSNKVHANATQIGNIQHEVQDLRLRPAGVAEEQVQGMVAKHFEAQTTIMDDKLQLLVNKKLESMNKEIDKVRAVQAVQAQTNARLSDTKVRAMPLNDDFEAKYLQCRRSVRLWPVDHSSEETLWAGVGEFFFDKLRIPKSNLPQETVEAIKRVMPGRRKQKIKNEVIVRFTTVQTRDMIVSYAPNLRDWRDQDGSAQNSTGLRLEIPDHLMSVFKTLERYGYYLKDKYKEGLRRHIRFDDFNYSLVLDYALPGEDVWERVDFETAREELRQHCHRGQYTPRQSRGSASEMPEERTAWGVPGQGGEHRRQPEDGHRRPQDMDQEA